MKLSTVDKFNKKDAFATVLEMKKTNTTPTSTDIDKLLNYFAPPLAKKAKNVNQWAALATNSTDVREFCRYLHVIKGVVNGCDGHRIHYGKTDLDDGAYCPKTLLPVGFDGNAPDFERIKGSQGHDAIYSHDSDKVINKISDRQLRYTEIDQKCRIMTKYLNDAVNHDDACYLYINPNDPLTPCVGSMRFGQFKIMGVRV